MTAPRTLTALLVAYGMFASTAAADGLLTKAAALRDIKSQLALSFGGDFSAGYGHRFDCRRRSRTRFRCHPSWIIGDARFYGVAQVSNSLDGSAPFEYSWRITRLDEYCADVQHRTHCTKTYVIK